MTQGCIQCGNSQLGMTIFGRVSKSRCKVCLDYNRKYSRNLPRKGSGKTRGKRCRCKRCLPGQLALELQ